MNTQVKEVRSDSGKINLTEVKRTRVETHTEAHDRVINHSEDKKLDKMVE